MKLKCCLLFLVILAVTCTKNMTYIPGPPANPLPPGGQIIGNKEYFWNKYWTKISNNMYQIKLNTWRLTDSAMNRGIKVHVAIYTDWSPYNQLPLTLGEPGLPDTINLFFTAITRELYIRADAPFNLNWASDFFIEYQ